mmetsp:Transcript_153723/g.492861  ORF Transcript_153723/g.492861 Transcript_153723/m.492861 type:complete len:684 (+) Transcript_153723:96-2147(+)
MVALRLLAGAALASLHGTGAVAAVLKVRSAPKAAGQQGLSSPGVNGDELVDLFSTPGSKPLAVVEADDLSAKVVSAIAREGHVRLVASVDIKTGRLSIKLQDAKSHPASSTGSLTPVAWAFYNNSMRQTGWGYLSVAATEDPHISRDLKMYAAGYLEGFTTAQQIRDFRHNAGILMQSDEDRHHALGNIQEVFGKSLKELCNRSGIHPGVQLLDDTQPSDAWWRQARLSLMQAWGTLDAYNTRVGDVHDKQMSMIDLLVLNSDGETPELEMAFDSEEYLLRQSQHDGDSDDVPQAFLQRSSRHSKSRPGAAASAFAAASAAQRRGREMQNLGEAGWRRIKESGGRCSALVRLTKDNKDLMVGHTTFSDYSEMNRIFKYYDFPNEDGVVRRMGFSSYPGVAGSTDDYYLLDSGLVITETTISMLTDEPYDKLDDSKVQIPDFMRIMVASRLAKTGAEWAKLMTDTSTGTYSSQWMVVDYNAFIPGSAVKNGTLTVIEQVPGMSRTADMSQRLQQMGFWGSENRAWFEDVRNASGSTEAEELHGALFSADNNPRANIFKATAPKVQTLADMRAELRRNKWPHEVDGGESNTPDHAISARGDLDKSRPNANGGVDSKVTNRCLARLLQCDAISGPTADDQQPFRWQDPATGKELFPGEPHDGLPNEWNFKWERMAPDGAAAAACLA